MQLGRSFPTTPKAAVFGFGEVFVFCKQLRIYYGSKNRSNCIYSVTKKVIFDNNLLFVKSGLLGGFFRGKEMAG